MDDVEGLRQTNEITIIGEGPGPFAALRVQDVRRTGNRRDRDVWATDARRARRISGYQVNRRGSFCQRALDQTSVKAHHLFGFVNGSARVGQHAPSPGRKNAQSTALKKSQRLLVDALNLVVGKDAQGRERIDEAPVMQTA